MAHLSDAAREKRSAAFLRYRSLIRGDQQKPADDMHDRVETWINEGGAGGDDGR